MDRFGDKTFLVLDKGFFKKVQKILFAYWSWVNEQETKKERLQEDEHFWNLYDP